MNLDELTKSMSEGEMALFVGLTVVMFSVIELGADRSKLLERLTAHENNFAALKQPKAGAMISMLKQGVQSTVPR